MRGPLAPVLGAILGLGWMPLAAAAVPGKIDGAVLARVGDRTITDTALREELAAALEDRPYINLEDPNERRDALDRLVDRQLFALGALQEVGRSKALADSARRIAELTEVWDALRDPLFAPPDALTDDALQKFREDRTTLIFGRHIVVDTEDQAKDVLKRLDAGEDFSTIAKELSVDIGTAAAGGRMFPVRWGDTYPPIYDLLKSLEPGKYGGPVRTHMGLHVALCDSVEYGLENEDIAPQRILRIVRKRLDYLEKADAWTASEAASHGIALEEAGVQEAFQHLFPTPANRFPPHLDPSWTASENPICTAKDGTKLSVADFFRTFTILGIDDWPRPRNVNTVRTAAQKLMLVWLADDAYEKGRFPLTAAAEARIAARVNRTLGQAFLDTETDPGPIDSARAEDVFKTHPNDFMVPESISISAIGVGSKEHADILYGLLQTGMSFDAVAAKAAQLDPMAYYTPPTPFIPKGQFPDTDDVLFALAPGDAAPPARVPKGFQIYKVVQKREPRPLRRVELSDEQLLERADQALRGEMRRNALAQLRERYPVKEDRDAVQKILGGQGR